jgi:hypothetical protein
VQQLIERYSGGKDVHGDDGALPGIIYTNWQEGADENTASNATASSATASTTYTTLCPRPSSPTSPPTSPQRLADSDMNEATAVLLREVEGMVREGKIKPAVYHAMRQLHAREAKSLRAVVLPPGPLGLILTFRKEGVCVEKIAKDSTVAHLLHEGNVLQSVCGVNIAAMSPREVQQQLIERADEHRTLIVLKDSKLESKVAAANSSTRGRSFRDLRTKSRMLEVKELADSGKMKPEIYARLQALNASPRVSAKGSPKGSAKGGSGGSAVSKWMSRAKGSPKKGQKEGPKKSPVKGMVAEKAKEKSGSPAEERKGGAEAEERRGGAEEEDASTVASIRQQLVFFYQKRFPDRVSNVDDVMARFAGREHKITKMIEDALAKEMID